MHVILGFKTAASTPEIRQKTARGSFESSVPDPRDRRAGRTERAHRRPGPEQPRRRTASTVREVQQAIADLDRQRTQLRLGGRTFIDRCSHSGAGAVLLGCTRRPRGGTAVPTTGRRPVAASTSARPVLTEESGGMLDRIREPRFSGVILKAPDLPEIIAACCG